MERFAQRYEIGTPLGSGAFGSVFRAFDYNRQTDVALKLLREGAGLDLAVFEASMLQALDGPFILPVHDAGEYQDVPYLATKIAAGGSVQSRILPYGIRPDIAIQWIGEVLLGLDVCHVHRILHRDVKPSNIFLGSES